MKRTKLIAWFEKCAVSHWAICYLGIASVFGFVFVFLTPAFQGTDEPAHFVRLAIIERGFVLPPTSKVAPTNYHLDACMNAYVSYHRLLLLGKDRPTRRQQFLNVSCQGGLDSTASASHAADIYSPVPYGPALIGFAIGRGIGGPVGSLFGARLAQMAVFIALMTFAIQKTPWGRPLLFTIGLLPVALQGAAGVSADPITLALAILTIAFTLSFIARDVSEPIPRGELITLGCVVAALSLCKSAYIPFAALILAIPTNSFGSLRRRIQTSAVILGIAGLFAAAWNFGIVSQVNIVGVNKSNSVEAAHWIQHHPIGFLKGIWHGWMGKNERESVLKGVFVPIRRWNQNYAMPISFGVVWLLVARIVDPLPRIFNRLRRNHEHSDLPPIATTTRLVSVVLAGFVAISTFLLVEYGLAIAANPPATHHIVWVQGRYFLPLVPLILFGVSGPGRKLPRRVLVAFPIVSIFVLTTWTWWMTKHAWRWV